MKTLLIAIGIALVIAGIYRGVSRSTEEKAPVAPQATTTAPTTTTSPANVTPNITWHFKDAGEGAQGEPLTVVSVSVNEKTYDLGQQIGSCFVTEWEPLPASLSGAICYFAGGGVEFSVYRENNAYVLKTSDVDEGDPEHPGVRGVFTASRILN